MHYKIKNLNALVSTILNAISHKYFQRIQGSSQQNNIMMMNFESQQLDEEYIANETIFRDYKNR